MIIKFIMITVIIRNFDEILIKYNFHSQQTIYILYHDSKINFIKYIISTFCIKLTVLDSKIFINRCLSFKNLILSDSDLFKPVLIIPFL